MKDHSLAVRLLLNIGHAIDHMFLLIFAASVGVIAQDFGFANWEDLMPYGAGAFLLFGIGSIPAGRLGDLWGRRQMMVVFFMGMGASALIVALVPNAWAMGAALAVMGAFASIYHPVGVPMLVQSAAKPGAVIGINGLAGNLGVALAAMLTGFLVKWLGWRAAFAVPACLSLICGLLFLRFCPHEIASPAKRKSAVSVKLPANMLARVLLVVTTAAVAGSILFNFTTNGNSQLMIERFRGVIDDPATLGVLLAAIYVIASLAQVVVGRLVDRFPVKPIFLGIVLCQIPFVAFAAQAQGWWMFVAMLGVMVFTFGAVPFTDVLIVRYVDDRVRSRVAGIRLAVSLGISSAAVWLLGPVVKQMGFSALFTIMTVVTILTALVVLMLPNEPKTQEA